MWQKERLLNIALEHNSEILLGKADLEAAYVIVVQTRAIALPKVQFYGNYKYDRAVEQFPFIAPRSETGASSLLGVTTPERSPIAPEIPTIAESGLKGYDMTNWYGLLVPAATPRASIAKLNGEVVRILNLPELKNRLADDGMSVVGSTPERFAEFLGRETAKYAKVIEAAGIKGTL